MKKIYTVPRNNKLKNLKIDASHKIAFSNNITSLNVVSTLQEQGITNYSNITNATIGQNVKELLPSCFIDCGNLKSVKTYGSLTAIDD